MAQRSTRPELSACRDGPGSRLRRVRDDSNCCLRSLFVRAVQLSGRFRDSHFVHLARFETAFARRHKKKEDFGERLAFFLFVSSCESGLSNTSNLDDDCSIVAHFREAKSATAINSFRFERLAPVAAESQLEQDEGQGRVDRGAYDGGCDDRHAGCFRASTASARQNPPAGSCRRRTSWRPCRSSRDSSRTAA